MTARTLNCAVSNDPPGVPGATPVVFKSPYSGNGGSARADLRSRRTRGTKLEDKNKHTIKKTQNIKTTATTIKTKPKSHAIDLEPEGNPFARRGSVSRSPPMLTRSNSKVFECSTASLIAEGKLPRPKSAKAQALTQNKKAIDLDSASVD